MDAKPPEDELEKRVKALESTVQALLGPNPAMDAWIKEIQALKKRVGKLEDMLKAAQEER